MHRLLQGDVGSGKTIIALYSMLIAYDNQLQTALMAPTEILAEQHYIVAKSFLKDMNVDIEILLGKTPSKSRYNILKKLENGDPIIIFGTHALIQEDVRIPKLALVVIDEQHKFGVMQRARMLMRGTLFPHFLVMTATPIPRTLALTTYGDLDISYLKEKPKNRGNVKTLHRYLDSRMNVYKWVFDRVLNHGDKAYVVAPLIEKSEKLEIQSATELYNELRKIAPKEVRLGLIHGRVPREYRQLLMEDFKRGVYHILVSTTVIEVGIDVPDATIMVIEHAERFGLSQLHQLRGRIGRGEKESYCILLTPYELTEEAKMRIKTLLGTQDGFKIAEMDLLIRGPGTFIGEEQHGYYGFRVANLLKDKDLLERARKDVEELLKDDVFLLKPEHKVLKTFVLKWLERDEKIFVG